MKVEHLSKETQKGLLAWAQFQHGDEMLWEGIASCPLEWAWICFQLRVADDNPEWFPHGKWATIQVIEKHLLEEAEEEKRK
ncbi:MAG TPA: hypothetical protein VH110_05225 [Candidatus Acidoferrum sp.]|jgi:hypothetical protein|nr:hypothetical protein [Candidatus Acidoferrum sp.]